jgi:PAS domain S-box-containing protein
MPEKSILIADDEAQIRKLLTRLLKDEGYRIFEAINGKEAVDVVRIHPIDLAILDIVMPEMDGVEALKRIKAFDKTIEVLMITGHADFESLRVIIFDYGAFDYLLKPFDAVELKLTVQMALHNRESIQKTGLLKDELANRILELEAHFKEKTVRLRESQIKYRNIVEGSTHAIVITQGNCVKFANSRFIQLIGYSREEMLNIPFIEFLHPGDRAAAMEGYQKRLRGEYVPDTSTFRVMRKDGIFFWAEGHAAKTLWGQDPALLHAMLDISERMEVEESLKIRDAALATSISGIGLADLEGNMTYVNRAFCQMWGYPNADEIMGKPIRIFLSNEADGAKAITALQESGGYVDQVAAVRKDGSAFSVQVSASMVTNESGEPICMMSSFLDITEQKKAEELMMRTEKLSSLGQLSAGLAHELRNPLAVISSCSQFCLENLNLERLVRENFEVIYRNSQRASKLISGLLAFARLDQLERSEVDINEILARVLGMTNLEVNPSHVTFVRHLDKGLPMIMGDREKLEQVFLNLIQNAIHAVGGRGTVIFESRFLEMENMVEASVIDNGAGIPQEYLGKVFDPFFTTKDGGTGLGLSVCYSIVEQHRGTIRVERVEEGGTQVSVRLPAAGKREHDHAC